MDGLKKFLGKYKHLVPPEMSKKKALTTVIKNECGVVIEETNITLRGTGVFIHCHPTLRGEIRLCTPRILEALNNQYNIRISFIR